MKGIIMAFTYNTKVEIFKKANGQCQCTREGCSHYGRCTKICQPVENHLASLIGSGDAHNFPGFEFHHIVSQEAGGASTAINGLLLCSSCHQKTKSYGNNLTT
jgi:hypothetical protein